MEKNTIKKRMLSLLILFTLVFSNIALAVTFDEDPKLSFDVVEKRVTVGDPFHIKVSAGDDKGLSKISYQEKNGDWIDYNCNNAKTCSYTFTLIKNKIGTYEFRGRAIDNAEHITVVAYDVIIVNPPFDEDPTLSFDVVEKRVTVGDTIHIKVDAQDDKGLSKISYQEKNGDWVDYNCNNAKTCSYTFSVVKNKIGTYEFRGRAIDNAEHITVVGYDTVVVNPPFDEDPTLSFDVVEKRVNVGDTIHIDGSAKDDKGLYKISYQEKDGEWIDYNCNDKKTCEYTFTVTKNKIGTYEFRGRAIDNAEHITVVGYDTVVVNPPFDEDPTLSFDVVEKRVNVGDTIHIKVDAQDDKGLYKISYQEKDGVWVDQYCNNAKTCSYTFSVVKNKIGTYEFRGRAIDNAEHITVVAYDTVVVNPLFIECYKDSDCGTNGLIGDEYCKEEDVYQYYKTYKCLNPGTKDSKCAAESKEEIKADCGEDSYSEWSGDYCKGNDVYKSRILYDKGCALGSCFVNQVKEEKLVEKCAGTCSEGECIRECSNGETQSCPLQTGVCAGSKQTCSGNKWPGCSAANYSSNYEAAETKCDGMDNDCDGAVDEGCHVQCSKDSDCGTDGFVGHAFCGKDDVYQYYQTNTCLNPGTADSICVSKSVEKIKEDCGEDSYSEWSGNYCKGNDVYKSRILYDKGCALGNCFVNQVKEEKLVERCAGTCSEGECIRECSNGETQSCPLQTGVCAGSKQTCSGNKWPGCSAANYGSNYEAVEKKCDGMDNDCDGMVDEGCHVQCSKDSDCGTDGFVGESSCKEGDVYQNYRAFKCENPGQYNSYCSYKDALKLKQDCGEDSYSDWSPNYCVGDSLYHLRTFFGKGCNCGSCFEIKTTQEVLIKECEFGCENGACKEEPINLPPYFTSTPLATFVVEDPYAFDSVYEYDADAVDPEGKTITYSLITAPEGMAINPLTGLIAWMPNKEQLGQHQIIIGASDRRLTATQSYVLNVMVVEKETNPREQMLWSRLNIIPEEVRAGEDLMLVVSLLNQDYYDMEDVKITAIIPDLSIRKKAGPFDIKRGSEVTKTFWMYVPAYVKPGKYDIMVVVSEGGELKRIKYREITVI